MANPDWDPQTFEKVELVPDIPPSTSHVPVMTDAQKSALPSPAIGTMVFCSDTDKLHVYDGAWVQIN